MTTRRKFIKETGLLAASFALAPALSHAFAPAQRPVGIQLYSLREIIGKDVKGVIEKLFSESMSNENFLNNLK